MGCERAEEFVGEQAHVGGVVGVHGAHHFDKPLAHGGGGASGDVADCVDYGL